MTPLPKLSVIYYIKYSFNSPTQKQFNRSSMFPKYTENMAFELIFSTTANVMKCGTDICRTCVS